MKMYECENPDCNNKVNIRVTLKSGIFKGFKVCCFCKNKLEEKKIKVPSNNILKRKAEREVLIGYYLKKKKKLNININMNLSEKIFCNLLFGLDLRV